LDKNSCYSCWRMYTWQDTLTRDAFTFDAFTRDAFMCNTFTLDILACDTFTCDSGVCDTFICSFNFWSCAAHADVHDMICLHAGRIHLCVTHTYVHSPFYKCLAALDEQLTMLMLMHVYVTWLVHMWLVQMWLIHTWRHHVWRIQMCDTRVMYADVWHIHVCVTHSRVCDAFKRSFTFL